jgi:hypothetical protein
MTDPDIFEQSGLPVKDGTNAISSISQNSVWYKSSYPFMIIALGVLSWGNFRLFLPLLIVAIINSRHENWQQYLWPWFLLLPLVVTCITNLLLLRIA